MCGITGIHNLNSERAITESNLRQMLAMLRHRGPDEFGIYLDDNTGLASARLSIIDLSKGQQPISNEDETLWIVFNGEIFNYIELRPELERRGHRFATHTDTEVIVHLYEDYGPDCLKYLNGQFAIAIWDSKTQTLFLARDRLGIRPVFYTVAQGALIFGSEIKSMLADDRVRAHIDPVSLGQIFTYWSPLSPRTVFQDIYEIPPAHYLLARNGEIKIEPYWQLKFPEIHNPQEAARPAKNRLEETLEEFKSLLVDATQIRLRADVPVGAYLSGGLDSSTTAAIIRNYTHNRLDTFSIAFSDPEFDESEYQIRMAKELGTDHHVVYATHEEIGRIFPDVIWHTEIPIMRTSPAPLYLLSRLVHEHRYKVVMTGEGADEFLAGYNIFKEAKIRRFWAKRPDSAIRPLLLRRLYQYVTDLSRSNDAYLRSFFGDQLTDVGAPDYSHAIRWKNNRRTLRFIHDAVRVQVDEGLARETPFFPQEFEHWEPLNRAQYLEISIFLQQYLLSSQGDRVGMANSVEGRFPFLDYRVVEFCNNLPVDLKLHGMTEKFLLKKLASQWLPEDIWRRPKRPYRAPIHHSFFNQDTQDYVRELLAPEAIREAGLFKTAAVSQLTEKVIQGAHIGETDDMALAGILSTQLVHEQFVRNFKMAPPIASPDDVKVCDRRKIEV